MYDKILDNIKNSIIGLSKVHGYGLFSTQDMTEDTFLGRLDGQVIDWDEFEALYQDLERKVDNLESVFFMEWNALDEETLLVRPLRTKYSFINHSRQPNVKLEYSGLGIEVVTLRKIEKGEEILIDYRKEPLRKEYLEGHGRTYL